MAQATEAKTDAGVPQPPPLQAFPCAPRPARDGVQGLELGRAREALVQPGRPTPFRTPRCEMRVGGPFDVCMRSPAGEEHWTRGIFVEVTPHTRLVIDMHATDSAGKPLFRAYTEVDFSDALGGTRMDVVQTYTFIDPSIAAPMVAGAPEGWRTTLDKLESEVVRMQGGSETGSPLGGARDVPSRAHLRRAGRAGVEGADRRGGQAEMVRRHARPVGIARAAHGRARRRQRAG